MWPEPYRPDNLKKGGRRTANLPGRAAYAFEEILEEVLEGF